MAAEDGLKAQKLLAQGSALGNVGKNQGRPERAKAFNFKAFALSGRLCFCRHYPGRCPGLGAFGLSARFNRTVRDFLFLLQLLKAFHLFRLQELVDAAQVFANPAMTEFIYLAHQTIQEVTVVTHHDERAVEI